jgi:hypothetical protein
VYLVDLGSFYVVPLATAPKELADWVFFGDAKTLYQQRIRSSYTTSTKSFDWFVWAPRTKGTPFGELERAEHKLTLICHPKEPHEFVPVGADEAKAFLASWASTGSSAPSAKTSSARIEYCPPPFGGAARSGKAGPCSGRVAACNCKATWRSSPEARRA